MAEYPVPAPASSSSPERTRGRPGEVFRVYLFLGLTSFGGPIAHLAYFRRELVERRRWLGETAYAELMAFCQFLPGPTSSQLGFLIGWHRAGVAGALAAWCGFTLPSVIIMLGAASLFSDLDTTGRWLVGMKAAVLAIVAQAVLSMARSLCPDGLRATIAAGVTIVCILSPAAWVPVAALVPAALAGLFIAWREDVPSAPSAIAAPSRTTTWTCLAILAAGAAVACGAAWMLSEPWGMIYATCFQAGLLVFGGGHVVLPLLHDPFVHGGSISDAAFMTGYGLAQVVPGPLFTVAAWLGMTVAGCAGAALAILAIFAPGMLLALGCLRFYHAAMSTRWARQAVAGLNAGVVGLLGAALWHPLGREAITGPFALALALLGFIALVAWRIPAWVVVIGSCALAAAQGRWA